MFSFKQHISIALTAALVFGMLWQTYTVIDFYMNREAITQEHCVNKDKPELDCKGQCHLQKQLEAATPDQDKKAESNGTSKPAMLLFVFAQKMDDLSSNEPNLEKQIFNPITEPTRHYSASVFNPPQWV